MTQPSHLTPLAEKNPGNTAPVEPDRPTRPVVVTPPMTATILLVDDDPGSLMAMETILAGPGRTIVKAESGQEALRHLLQQDFAVILLDVRMPRLDGFETAALIRQRARSRYTPIIFLSAVDTMDADVLRGLSSGAVDYLFKPVVPEVLQMKVSVFVDLFRLSEHLKDELNNRKRAEEALRESEAQLQAILDNSPAIIMLKDTQGRYLKINPPFAKLTRLPSDQILGKTDEEIFPPAQAAAFHANDAKVLQAGMPLEFEEVAQHEDGPHHSIVYKFPLYDAEGKIYAIGGIVIDITERKRAEAQLEQRSAELEAVNQELNTFTFSVAHDLRAPLRAMQGFSQALLEDYGDRLDHVGQEYAQRIASAAQHLDGLIDDLLAYSRLNHAELKLRPVDLTRLLKDVQGHLKTRLQEQQAQLTIRQTLPRVLGHDTTLGQVLQNLLSNAVKFVASGVKPQVRVWAEERDKLVRLWVEDNGIGIAPEHQERIFRIFERLHGIETYPGTGIGLAIVRKAVERMGGRVGVESAVGQGSKFWVELPSAGCL